MAAETTWRGDHQETLMVAQALLNNCECKTVMGMPLSICSVHLAFRTDQRFLDGLITVRRWMVIRRPGAAQRVILSA